MHYDNIEIGTADFRLLIADAPGNGISVEPVPHLFEKLPDREGWEKLNAAISTESGEMDMWYVNPEFYDVLPTWAKGCNKLGEPHPSILKEHQLKITVPVITIREFFERFDITSVNNFKIDTEGHDYDILMDYFGSDLPKPERLTYESNELTSDAKLAELKGMMKAHYEIVSPGRFNTFCKHLR